MGNLNDSVKVPIINVYNFNTELIASSNSKVTPGVSVISMVYKYDDDGEDECTIKIQASHNKWLDALGLYINTGEQDSSMVIRISWGYVGGPKTTTRSVVIRDIKSKYGPNIIYTELVCTDFTTYLKVTNSEFIESVSPLEYIQKYCGGKLNVGIVDRGDLVYQQGIDEKLIEPGQKELIVTEKLVTEIEYNGIWIEVESRDTKPAGLVSRVSRKVTKELRDKKIVEVGNWSDTVKDDTLDFFTKVREVNVISKSPYTVLRGILDKAPNGPWFVTGRDNLLAIHNRGVGNDISRVYTYNQEPGYLIDFVAETKYDAFKVRSISLFGLDPQAKEAKFLDSYMKALQKTTSAKAILTSTKINDAEKAERLEEWVLLKNGGYQKFQTIKSEVGYDLSGNINTNPDTWKLLPSGSSNESQHKSLDPVTIDNLGGKRTRVNNLDYIIQTGMQYSTPVEDISEAASIVQNEARKLSMEKEEAKMIFEGDPSLKTGMVFQINGVMKVHSGRYYVKTCEHTISSMGYKVSIDSFKIIPEDAIEQHISSETYKPGEDGSLNIDGESKYYLEQSLFGIEVLVQVGTGKTEFELQPFGHSAGKAEKVYEYIPLSEYLKDKPDKQMYNVVKLYHEGKIRFKNNVEDR